jgi:hypothetical protein
VKASATRIITNPAHGIGSILLLLLIFGTAVCGQVWADKFEGTEGPDTIIGTPEDDEIDSKGGIDRNFGDSQSGEGSGDDNIDSGEDNDNNYADVQFGEGSDNFFIFKEDQRPPD